MLKAIAMINDTSIENAEKLGRLFGIYFQLKNDMDKDSAKQDRNNGIYTLLNILDIEKTDALLDNYRKEVIACIHKLPENMFRDELEGLVNNYDR